MTEPEKLIDNGAVSTANDDGAGKSSKEDIEASKTGEQRSRQVSITERWKMNRDKKAARKQTKIANLKQGKGKGDAADEDKDADDDEDTSKNQRGQGVEITRRTRNGVCSEGCITP